VLLLSCLRSSWKITLSCYFFSCWNGVKLSPKLFYSQWRKRFCSGRGHSVFLWCERMIKCFQSARAVGGVRRWRWIKDRGRSAVLLLLLANQYSAIKQSVASIFLCFGVLFSLLPSPSLNLLLLPSLSLKRCSPKPAFYGENCPRSFFPVVCAKSVVLVASERFSGHPSPPLLRFCAYGKFRTDMSLALCRVFCNASSVLLQYLHRSSVLPWEYGAEPALGRPRW